MHTHEAQRHTHVHNVANLKLAPISASSMLLSRTSSLRIMAGNASMTASDWFVSAREFVRVRAPSEMNCLHGLTGRDRSVRMLATWATTRRTRRKFTRARVRPCGHRRAAEPGVPSTLKMSTLATLALMFTTCMRQQAGGRGRRVTSGARLASASAPPRAGKGRGTGATAACAAAATARAQRPWR